MQLRSLRSGSLHSTRAVWAWALILTVLILTFSAEEMVANCLVQGLIQFCTTEDVNQNIVLLIAR